MSVVDAYIVTQNTFYALYRSFTKCCFVEDEGDVLFYKDRYGRTQRALAE